MVVNVTVPEAIFTEIYVTSFISECYNFLPVD